MKKIKKTVKIRWIKDVVGKLTNLIKPKKFPNKILLLSEHAWQRGLRLFGREFCIAAMLNPSLKSRFIQEFIRFSMILTGLVGYDTRK